MWLGSPQEQVECSRTGSVRLYAERRLKGLLQFEPQEEHSALVRGSAPYLYLIAQRETTGQMQSEPLFAHAHSGWFQCSVLASVTPRAAEWWTYRAPDCRCA